MISEFYVGQKPQRPLGILIKDGRDNPANLSGYDQFKVEIVDTDNRSLNLEGVELNTGAARDGRFIIYWPKDRSLFTRPGEYVLRIAMGDSAGSLDYTKPHTIMVREFGGKN